jgi:hypothetical protein
VTSIRYSVATGLLVGTLLATGCGKVTRLGQVRPEPDGGGAMGGEGGAAASGGASGTAGESGTAGDSGASGNSGAVGTSATGGASGSGVAGSSTSDAGPNCHLPKPTPISNPSAEDLERARLIHEFCATLARVNCFNLGMSSQIYAQAAGCSAEERTTACEQDVLYEYVKEIVPACDDEWQTAIKCLAAATHVSCQGAGLRDLPTRVCGTEKAALAECIGSNPPLSKATGSRTTCYYGTGTHAPCEVYCSGGNYFTMDCGGPPGLPLACNCIANGADTDFRNWDDGTFYASDCQDAAQSAADGVWCTNRLDCCIEWLEGGCTCGSNNLGGFRGSCEEYAANNEGRRVEICPRYQD